MATPAEFRQQCADALASSQNLKAFLRVIRAGEGTADAQGYSRHYGGAQFVGFFEHPNKAITAGQYTSTAAGAYQFLASTWAECKAALELRDFSPQSQDLAAVFLIQRRGALPDAMAGRLDAAIAKCAKEWASLPGSPYGQPQRTLAQARATYLEAGGLLADQPQQEQAMPIPAIVGALLPILTNAVPELVKLIKPGSESAQQNAAVATKVFEVAQQALGATNAQAVAEQVQADPKAAQIVRDAVREQWFTLSDLMQVADADEKSRDAAADRNIALAKETGGRWLWLVGAIALIVVIFSLGVSAAVLFVSGFSNEIRIMVLTSVIVMGFTTVITFIFGSSLSSKVQQLRADK